MRLSFILSSLLMLSTIPAYAHDTENDYTSLLAKTIQYTNQTPSPVWLGFQLKPYAVLIELLSYGEEGWKEHSYAFQFHPKDASRWKRLEIENLPVYFSDDIDFTGGFHTIDDQLVYALRVFLEGDNRIDIISFISGRLFKDYQYNHSHFPQDQLNTNAHIYDAFKDIPNIAYAAIERAILKDYISHQELDSLKNYLAIHHQRTEALNTDSKNFEKALELSVGTRRYVGLKSLNLSDGDHIKEILQKYPEPPSDYCASLSNIGEISICLTEQQYNFVDLTLGYALDKIDKPNWKNTVEMSGIPFSSLLETYYPMSKTEMDQRVEQSKIHYQFSKLTATLEENIMPYLIELQTQEEHYHQLPGYEVNLDVRGCSSLLPNHIDKVYLVNSQFRLYTNYKARYLCDGDNYRMNILHDYIPFVYNGDDSERFKMTANTLLVVDGQQETVGSYIQAGKKQPFHRLLIENEQALIRINGLEGILDGTNNQLMMTITDKKWLNHHANLKLKINELGAFAFTKQDNSKITKYE